MRIFQVKNMARFARKQRITDANLREAIDRAEQGQIDADLGGGLFKQRVARSGQGRSGGFRTILAYRASGRAVFLYGFAKNERGNIEDDELKALRAIGKNWLSATIEAIEQALKTGDLLEIEDERHTPQDQTPEP
jgi:hypothetical protein